MIADVFNSNVYSLPAVNSAALGGAYRALHLFKGGTEKVKDDFDNKDFYGDFVPPIMIGGGRARGCI